MQLSDVFSKIATQGKVTPSEIEFLKLQGRQLQENTSLVNGWVNGESDINVRKIRAQGAFFERMPNSIMSLDKSANTSIAHDTFTTISNYSPYLGAAGDTGSTSNDFFELDTANGRIYMKQASRTVGFYLWNVFSSNPTGHRACRMYQYNRDGTEAGVSSAWRLAATNGGFTMATTIFRFWGAPRDIGDYATMKVYQNSGGALDLTDCAFATFIIR